MLHSSRSHYACDMQSLAATRCSLKDVNEVFFSFSYSCSRLYAVRPRLYPRRRPNAGAIVVQVDFASCTLSNVLERTSRSQRCASPVFANRQYIYTPDPTPPQNLSPKLINKTRAYVAAWSAVLVDCLCIIDVFVFFCRKQILRPRTFHPLLRCCRVGLRVLG